MADDAVSEAVSEAVDEELMRQEERKARTNDDNEIPY